MVLNRPFHYDHEGIGCFYGVLARNFFQFSWAETWGLPILTVGAAPGTPILFYNHHPPLVPLLIAPVYFLFGVGEWQTRLPTSMATVASIFVLFLLMDRVSTRRVALTAAALYAATPMILYYGGLPEVVSMPLVLFILLALMAYLNFHRQPGITTFLPLIIFMLLAGFSDWPAFIMVPVFLVHFISTRPRRQWPWILAFCLAAVIIFSLIYLYITVAAHISWDWMIPLVKKRSAIGFEVPFTAVDWLVRAVKFNLTRHTLPLLLAAGVGLALTWGGRRRGQPGAAVAYLLLSWGIIHALVGRQGIYIHEWWWAPLTPGLAVSAALFVDRLCQTAEKRGLVHFANSGAVVLILLFSAWTACATYGELYPAQPRLPFSTMELGRAIQAAAPQPHEVALVVWCEPGPQLWFYGNRPLRIGVGSIAEFQGKLLDDSMDLPFGFVQPYPAPAAGIVFPAVYRDDLADLLAYLKKHYPPAPFPDGLAGKFYLFDLRRPLFASSGGRPRTSP